MVLGSLRPVLQNVNVDTTDFSIIDLSQNLCLILEKEEEIDEKMGSLFYIREFKFWELRRASNMGFSTLVIHWNQSPCFKRSHYSINLKILRSKSGVGIGMRLWIFTSVPNCLWFNTASISQVLSLLLGSSNIRSFW